MAGYSGTPLPKKLGVNAGHRVLLDGAPAAFDLRELPSSAEVTQRATDRIMDAITVLLEEIRGEKAPAERYDPRARGITEIGNPNKKKKGRRP